MCAEARRAREEAEEGAGREMAEAEERARRAREEAEERAESEKALVPSPSVSFALRSPPSRQRES